jgi:eukaryotic-like serine/threonine-protein kinase
MRFIKGDSLKEAIDQFHADISLKNDPGRRSFELRKRLRRFLDICNAIDYAHSRGVIHRDLKPANIILGKHGETLVVDWGLAKAVGRADPSVGEQTIAPSSSGSSETMPGSAMGTPAYMSPEQARGDLDRLGPRSDVYSLGATLYCLLTGKPPFEGDDVGEILRKVQRGDFVPPRQLESSLDAALEAICLKAMANQPGDRYPSCRALADDVEQWMADEPVSAWAEPWTRKLLRWLTRHRTEVTGAAAAVLAGVVDLSAVLAVQARANLALADKNTALTAANAKIEARYSLAVEAIKTFHTGVSEDFLLKEEKFKELRDRLLKSASDFYGKLGALLGKDTDIASRRALAQSNFELADLTSKVGRNEDALAAHLAVLAAREALAAQPAAGVVAKVDVGRSMIAVAELLEATGKTDEALASYRRSESLLAGPAGSSSGPARPPRRWRPTSWRAPIRRRWPSIPGPQTMPASTWRKRSSASATCSGTRASRRRRRPSSAGRWRSSRSWPTTTPPSPNSAATWRGVTSTSGGCWRTRAGRRRRRPSSARRWHSGRSWPTTTPPSPNSAAAWRTVTGASAGR